VSWRSSTSTSRFRHCRGQLPEDSQVRVVGIEHDLVEQLRTALQASGWDEVDTIVIDSATRAEELAAAHVLATVPHEKGHRVRRIEDYGYGKGYTHIYDTMLLLLADLDAHVRQGRNVVLICHDCTQTVPNPSGEDWIRYEPRLQLTASGKAAVRLRVREWADHLLFIGYDVHVTDGKAQGGGTRTIYPTEQVHCMAKSRKLSDALLYDEGSREIWDLLFAD
jgi:hypothetical protein